MATIRLAAGARLVDKLWPGSLRRPGGSQASWLKGLVVAGGDPEDAARRVADALFQEAGQDRDGSIRPGEFRATVGPRLFESVGGALSFLQVLAPAARTGEPSFAAVLGELRTYRRCVVRAASSVCRHLHGTPHP